MKRFTENVKAVVRDIPSGKVLTYSQVATMAGSPKAARAVANIMARNFDPNIPCHRVIRSNGRPGGYNRGGEVVKQRLLEAEAGVLLP